MLYYVSVVGTNGKCVFKGTGAMFLSDFRYASYHGVVDARRDDYVATTFGGVTSAFMSLFYKVGGIESMFKASEGVYVYRYEAMSGVPIFVLYFTSMDSFSVALFCGTNCSVVASLYSVASGLVVFYVRVVRAKVGGVLRVFFRGFRGLFVAAARGNGTIGVVTNGWL